LGIFTEKMQKMEKIQVPAMYSNEENLAHAAILK
jgi:hypothetical protein